jgi:hypothetical protein
MRIPKSLRQWRERRRKRLHNALLRNRHPRLAFTAIVLLTGLSAFLFSAGLHGLGMTSMGWRYGLTVVFAYAIFVLLVWTWLRREWLENAPDVVPTTSDAGNGGSGDAGGHFDGGGGSSGGAGASADYAGEEGPATASAESGGIASEVLSGAGEAAGGAIGEGCAPVILVGLLLAGVVAIGWWVLSFAPLLAAEFLADAMLMALLYRRMRRFDEPVLVQAIFRRTRTAFGVSLVVIVAAAVWMQLQVPGATTLGQVWSHYAHSQ